MDRDQFISILAGHTKDYRNREPITNMVLQNPAWVPLILKRMADVGEKDSAFAARILELTCKRDLKIILPYLEEFTTLLARLEQDGSIRASAKIIELLCAAYFITDDSHYRDSLTDLYLQKFTEACFDWMIANSPTAIQAHAMYSLYLLGYKFEWIHNELIETINKRLAYGSTGYQNRGKKVILAIEKQKFLKLY